MKQKTLTGLPPAVGKGFRPYANFQQQRDKNNLFRDDDVVPGEMAERKKRTVTKKTVMHYSAADELPDPNEDRPE